MLRFCYSKEKLWNRRRNYWALAVKVIFPFAISGKRVNLRRLLNNRHKEQEQPIGCSCFFA